ncbi:hypothetical protein GCM10009826_12990 [Humibacillus xanthopallidus]
MALGTAFVDEGVPHVAFWNGRVLTAEDLREEQAANQLAHNRLGRAIGAGVLSGLTVRRASDTEVTVGAGLAVDRWGQVVELPVDVKLSLVVPATPTEGDGGFSVCEPISSSPTGTGVYLLVIRGASDSRSSVSGVPALGSGIASACGPRYTVDGVSFRLVGIDPIPLATASGHDAADLAVLGGLATAGPQATARNILAHLFLDTRAWARRLADPFGADQNAVDPGTLAALSSGPLTPCDVPIAVLTWAAGIDLVDLWSVRRAPLVHGELTAVQGLASTVRSALGRAAYCQFQDQLAQIATELTPAQRTAFRLLDRFRYLPPAGLVPIARAGRTGFDATKVLAGLTARGPAPLDPARVGAVLDDAVHHLSVDAVAGDVLNVYTVTDPADLAAGQLLFTTGWMELLVVAALAIDSVRPGGPLVLGQDIEIRGRNFDFSSGSCRITFTAPGQNPINANPANGSSDTSLLVKVPTALVVDPDGTEVTLRVVADTGADDVPVMVGHVDQPVSGALHVSWLDTDSKVVDKGDPLLLRYAVRSVLDAPAEVAFEVVGNPVVVGAATIEDEAGNPVDGPVVMQPDQEIRLAVRFGAVPSDPSIGGQGFLVSLAASAGSIYDDDIRAIQFRAPITPNADEIRIETVGLDLNPGTQGTRRGSTIEVSKGGVVTVQTTVRFASPLGPLSVRVNPVSAVARWQAALSSPLNGRVDGDATEATVRVSFLLNQGPGNVETAAFSVDVARDASTRTSRIFLLTPL